jgi:hypothetical protein
LSPFSTEGYYLHSSFSLKRIKPYCLFRDIHFDLPASLLQKSGPVAALPIYNVALVGTAL